MTTISTVKQVYRLRRDFILIGLTGKTGSGCSSVAELLSTRNFCELKTEYRSINTNQWDNDSRKNRIVHNYMRKHWHPFTVIHASNVIFFQALQLSYDEFVQEFCTVPTKPNGKIDVNNEVAKSIGELKDQYNDLHGKAEKIFIMINEAAPNDDDIDEIMGFFINDIRHFRELLEEKLRGTSLRITASVLQRWGNNIRKYDHIQEKEHPSENAPACLAIKIDRLINLIRKRNSRKTKAENYTYIVIDALRNPFEVLYFREQYSAFYLMSINTDEQIRKNKLIEKGFTSEAIEALDEKELGREDFSFAYQDIDINRCIELSDIHLTHDGTYFKDNRKLTNQIVTYLALIRHPGLVSPSPMERIMQMAYTAKLNSGCLSRQVGAVVTNSDFSVLAVGWNTVPQGQTPCTLRCLNDYYEKEDEQAYSDFERNNKTFAEATRKLYNRYQKEQMPNDPYTHLLGVPLAYCFKDIHTSTADGQEHNQVHTRALHAEENAFLQLAKYGTQGVHGGKLFTTSSCCELCGKKAYQLGIREIYYIDSYPGITHSHIIRCGNAQPQMKLFHGAIGRAYSNLYNPFLPLKDEIAVLSEVNVKDILNPREEKNGNNGTKPNSLHKDDNNRDR